MYNQITVAQLENNWNRVKAIYGYRTMINDAISHRSDNYTIADLTSLFKFDYECNDQDALALAEHCFMLYYH